MVPAIRVMQSFQSLRDTTNPYLKQLLASTTGEHCQPRTFSRWAAVRGDFDVLHVHWPEVLVRGTSQTRTWARRVVFLLILIRIRTSRRALVRTLHNVTPHESGARAERLLLRWCDSLTTLWITLVPSTPLPVGASPVRRTIPHGHYRDWFEAEPTTAVTGRILYFGLIRPYKGVENLLEAFAGLDVEEATLRVVGAARDPHLAVAVTTAVARDPRVSARMEYVSDEQLALEVGAAELVVLPYREMHNSGSALLALSLNRPILVPRNAVTLDLASEVGLDWVHLFDGDVTTSAIEAALAHVRTASLKSPPSLGGRDWPAIGTAHVAAYRAALASRGRRN